MSLKLIFSIISVVIGFVAFYPYIHDVFQKKTKPHEFTWLIWAITQGVATVGLWVGGGGIGALNLTFGTALVILVFLLSLRDGQRNVTRSDVAVLVGALLAVGVWIFLKSPVASVLLVSAIDVIGYVPTFRKSFHDPWSETTTSWATFSTSNGFALLALEQYNLLTVTYLAAISAANLLLLIFLLIRRQAVSKPSH